jgi:hypothetical protein
LIGKFINNNTFIKYLNINRNNNVRRKYQRITFCGLRF